MIYGFVHAPYKNGWQGELLLELHKDDGVFVDKDFKRWTDVLYPHDDWIFLKLDKDVPPQRVQEYLLRREKGLMQRRTQAGTYEDMLWHQWIEGIRRNYPDLAVAYEFVGGAFIDDEASEKYFKNYLNKQRIK